MILGGCVGFENRVRFTLIAQADRAVDVQRVAHRRIVGRDDAALEPRAVDEFRSIEILRLSAGIGADILDNAGLPPQTVGGDRPAWRRRRHHLALAALTLLLRPLLTLPQP